MAHLNVKPDPALLKLAAMQKTRYYYFRWTPRTAKITFMYLGVVPALVGYVAYATDGLWDLRGKRKGDTVYER
ncbi:hypothetical protein HIM_12066 [Hirsutella minnesotensis 3608]|uniref:NADH-ubiquinone oxidoreductase B15 subunit n=1 Tax=Hirsutella minnesotensis 3608 TaxID=1043627 RepID=A0A0F7ZQV8_9HYPO|nr:hypothetical protein HIM_12066 [Hirsutella minnesotensis 3608]